MEIGTEMGMRMGIRIGMVRRMWMVQDGGDHDDDDDDDDIVSDLSPGLDLLKPAVNYKACTLSPRP